MKQMILNNNDHRVADVQKPKSNAKLVLDYANAANLNRFFEKLRSEELSKFKTIQFKDLISLHQELFGKSLAQGESLQTNMASEAQRKAIAKFQATKARVNIWMSPDGKEKLTEYAKTTPEKSVQKYLLRLIKDESGIDCETANNDK